jgi:hypothetical protein
MKTCVFLVVAFLCLFPCALTWAAENPAKAAPAPSPDQATPKGIVVNLRPRGAISTNRNLVGKPVKSLFASSKIKKIIVTQVKGEVSVENSAKIILDLPSCETVFEGIPSKKCDFSFIAVVLLENDDVFELWLGAEYAAVMSPDGAVFLRLKTEPPGPQQQPPSEKKGN